MMALDTDRYEVIIGSAMSLYPRLAYSDVGTAEALEDEQTQADARREVIRTAQEEWSDPDKRAFISKMSPTTTLARWVDASLRGARMEPLTDDERSALDG